MSERQFNNKRIAKNAIYMYFRLLVTMALSLYSSRLILEVVGIEDFGIFTIIGGVVAMLSVFTGTVSGAISRFMAFALGKGDKVETSNVFSSSINIIVCVTLFVVIVAELGGPFFVRTLNIPANRMDAALWVFHASVISFALSFINVINHSCIIAYEKMSFYAYASILDSITKLSIILATEYIGSDKLKVYASFIILQSLLYFIINSVYVKLKFKECIYRFVIIPELLNKLFNYIGWTFIGSMAFIAKNQGVDILLNMFFGPVVNASKGIASQVSHAANQFGSGFLSAILPQITKSYAAGNHDYTRELTLRGLRFSFYLLLLITIPLCYNIDYILNLWLNVVPDKDTAIFAVLSLGYAVFESVSLPFNYVITASGNIKNYQIIATIVQFATLPIVWVLLILGYRPVSAFVVSLLMCIVLFIVRYYYARKCIDLSLSYIWNSCLRKMGLVLLFPLSLILINIPSASSFTGLIVNVAVFLFVIMVGVYLCGLTSNERIVITNKIMGICRLN